MIWEVERHNWEYLRAAGSAILVPDALHALGRAESADEARDAYWRIDNVVVVQGSLFQAAPAATACLTSILPRCSPVARTRVLELLVQLGSGTPDPSEITAGNTGLTEACVGEIAKGIALYLHLLESGNDDERGYCVDLLGLCARHDKSLQRLACWYVERLLLEEISEGLQALARDWLEELRESRG
jgi:hypothetical protein